ncbi:hypothetical protein [Selenihalanaerobacter shriftii]|uniref:DUF4359 domain-containing protein n=1 Tax=Selenihalanaerobacter shriftii TaxID=142842 RepID=A0A1T4LY02_9FIRM|nr:hypothetical protein [Selenihalanaerobacter shriftii]SJZ59552.1 hypothetical protein SAMN02745118_01290 [Selenihalanaerobacter shriftii]
MKKSIIILCIAVLVLYITNPTPVEFSNWLDEEISKQTEDSNILEKGLANLIEKPLIKSSANHKNYYLFTVFKVENKYYNEIVVIGVLDNFIKIKGSFTPK